MDYPISGSVNVPGYDDAALKVLIADIDKRLKKLEAGVAPLINPKPFKKDAWCYSKVGGLVIDPNSLAIVNDLALQAKDMANGGTAVYFPAIALDSYSVPIFHVTSDIPKKNLVYSVSSGNKQTMFRVPDGILAAAGTDKHSAIYDWVENRFVDLYQFDPNTNKANHGGVIDNFPSSDGTFPNPMGARACGIAATIGVITIDDLKSGVHDGVVAIASGRTNRSPKWPSNRVDGFAVDGPLVRMGQRFRLPSTFVPDSSWPPILKIISVAARDYGMVVIDTTFEMCINMAYVEDPRPRGKTVAEIKTAYWGGWPDWKMGQTFPWRSLNALA